jgi:hypothetical protein
MNAFLHKGKMHFAFSALLILMWHRKVELFQNSSEFYPSSNTDVLWAEVGTFIIITTTQHYIFVFLLNASKLYPLY